MNATAIFWIGFWTGWGMFALGNWICQQLHARAMRKIAEKQMQLMHESMRQIGESLREARQDQDDGEWWKRGERPYGD